MQWPGFIEPALAMGASGVQLTSIFMLAQECEIADNAKQKIIDSTDTDTVITGYGTAHVVRGLKNQFSEQFFKMQKEGVSPQELGESLQKAT